MADSRYFEDSTIGKTKYRQSDSDIDVGNSIYGTGVSPMRRRTDRFRETRMNTVG